MSGPPKSSDDALVQAAWAARDNAYAPYSGFPVGAALRVASGTVYVGVNLENAAYPAGICAERSAIATAITAGERELDAIAIATDTDHFVSPCGLCRQTLYEFAPHARVILSVRDDRRQVTTVDALLPHAFGPSDLPAPDRSKG